MTKNDIAKEFLKLKKYGYKVKSFGDNRSLRRGQTGFVDTVIFNRKNLIFIEVKVGKDTFSEEQLETADLLSSVAAINKTVYYYIVNDVKDAKLLVDIILRGDL